MTLPLLPLVLDDVPRGLRLALAQEGVPAVRREHAPRAGQFVICDSRRGSIAPAEDGQTLIDIHALRGEYSRDPFDALLDEQAERFQWRIGSTLVSEEVARVDKRAVRSRLMSRLRRLLEQAGGVWMKLAAWPFPHRSAFNFRLDHDEYDEDDFHAVMNAVAGHEASVSHYVCASTHESEQAALLRLRGSDVGSHGYWHHTYYDAEDNLKNIRRGIEVLQRAGLEPSGYVAPHGRFNRGLLWAMESLGITHSSEFALAYDEWPFFPPGSSVLQIPVHPICLGLFLESLQQDVHGSGEARRAAEQATAHLVQTIEDKYHAGEPVFLYGHPDGRLGRYPDVVRSALDAAAGYSGLWRIDRTTIARWWAQRLGVSFSVRREGDCFVVRFDTLPAAFQCALEYWRGEHVAVMPVTGGEARFSPEAVAYERRRSLPSDARVRIDPSHDLKSRVRRYLDWEKVTPVEEINSGSLRGWLKKTLRRARK